MNEPLVEPRTSPWLVACALLAIVVASHVLVLANPGYYSHDEWQRADFVRDHGISQYVQAFGKIIAGPNFGHPVRPIGFVQQALSSTWMTRAPIVPHAVDVCLHALVVLLLWALLLKVDVSRRRALLAASVFAISPLAATVVGWVGASFDTWYVLFSLACAYGVAKASRDGLGFTAASLAVLGSAGAIGSKEAAVMLPAALAVALFALHHQGRIELRLRPAVVAIALACIPIIIYLLIRLPAIQATLSGNGGSYSPSVSNVPGNAFVYFAQPFIPGALGLNTVFLLPKWQSWLGIAVHAALLTALWRRFGWQSACAYLAGYFVFLLPVLTLPTLGTHYLYGSGLAFAIAIAFVLVPAHSAAPTMGLQRALVTTAVLLVAVLLGRSLFIQQDLYSVGKCQSEFLSSFEPMAEAAVLSGSKRLHVSAAPGTRDYIAFRSVFGRTQFMEGGRWPTVFGPVAAEEGDANLIMKPDCRVASR